MKMHSIYIYGAMPAHEKLRDKVALENGFSLYKRYNEKLTASFIGRDLSTLKRWRRKGRFIDKFPTEDGDDGVMYLGTYIADCIILGTGKWPDVSVGMIPETSRSAPIGSANETAAQPGIDAGQKVDGPSALRLARQTLKSRKSD